MSFSSASELPAPESMRTVYQWRPIYTGHTMGRYLSCPLSTSNELPPIFWRASSNVSYLNFFTSLEFPAASIFVIWLIISGVTLANADYKDSAVSPSTPSVVVGTSSYPWEYPSVHPTSSRVTPGGKTGTDKAAAP